ncbi:hypothetical protein [Acidaminococcus sp.]|uniref:hypothetical protein n=1 Tax=Acidaminococcus sp. TaxID=1872103 RepID=UPI00351FA4E7
MENLSFTVSVCIYYSGKTGTGQWKGAGPTPLQFVLAQNQFAEMDFFWPLTVEKTAVQAAPLFIFVPNDTKTFDNGTKSGKTLKFPQSLCYKNRYSIV